jgi:hypothetical protein
MDRNITYFCAHCDKRIDDITNVEIYCEGDIWFGCIEKYLYLDDTAFCSFDCFNKFITNWYNSQLNK